MACYHPIPALRPQGGGPWILHGKAANKNAATDVNPTRTHDATIPCGKCLGCRTATQLMWTIRCTHEAQHSPYNTFITLTYDDDHLPHELVPYHLTTFIKRLRRATPTTSTILTGSSKHIRYLACGEYGDKTLRPHYHINVFNCAFKDQQRWSKTLYTSETLDRIWGHGAAKLAPFTPATAGYVAGYITQHGRRDYYNTDGETLEPPFKRQSQRPAIGLNWLKKNHADLAHGYLIHDGKKHPIPRYYKKVLQHHHDEQRKLHTAKTLQEAQLDDTNQHLSHSIAKPRPASDAHHPDRLKAAEQIHAQQQRNRDNYGNSPTFSDL